VTPATITTFFALLSGLLDGFRARAEDVRDLLTDAATAFLIVTSPDRAPLEEAIYFAAELEREGIHRCGVIVNRVHPFDPTERDIATTATRLQDALGAPLAGRVARAHADVQRLARSDQVALERLRLALHEAEPICLADREADVHDVAALVELQRELFGAAPAERLMTLPVSLRRR